MWFVSGREEPALDTLHGHSSLPLLIVSPACVIIETEGSFGDDADGEEGKRAHSLQRSNGSTPTTQRRTTIAVYERKSGLKLWEGKREAGVILRETDDSWYMLRPQGLFSLIVGQTQDRLLHNMIMGGEYRLLREFLQSWPYTDLSHLQEMPCWRISCAVSMGGTWLLYHFMHLS